MEVRVRVTAVVIRDSRILVIECHDPRIGPHLNLPGGGLEVGETIEHGLKREFREECDAEITIGRLLTVSEFLPGPDDHDPHSVILAYEGRLAAGSEPRMPPTPDTFQTGVAWLSFQEVDRRNLLPPILGYVRTALEERKTIHVGRTA